MQSLHTWRIVNRLLFSRDLFIICPTVDMAEFWTANTRASVHMYHLPEDVAYNRCCSIHTHNITLKLPDRFMNILCMLHICLSQCWPVSSNGCAVSLRSSSCRRKARPLQLQRENTHPADHELHGKLHKVWVFIFILWVFCLIFVTDRKVLSSDHLLIGCSQIQLLPCSQLLKIEEWLYVEILVISDTGDHYVNCNKPLNGIVQPQTNLPSFPHP